MGFFQDLFGDTAADAAKTAAAQKQAGLVAAQNYAEPKYAQAATDVSKGYQAAQGVWNPVNAIGTAGASTYADFTGANGPEGQARARALFQTDPGYQFARDEALQATQRATGTGGFQDSGNVLTALQDRASGLASKQYGDYVARLAPFLGYSLGGAQGASGAYTGEGTALSGLDTSLAQLGYGTQAGIGSAQAAGTLGEAAARTAAANNIASLGTKLLGYAIGGPIGGSIGSAFGGGSGGLDFGNVTDEQIMRGYA